MNSSLRLKAKTGLGSRNGSKRYWSKRFDLKRYASKRYASKRFISKRCGSKRYGSKRYETYVLDVLSICLYTQMYTIVNCRPAATRGLPTSLYIKG
ncbi:hypothetical protein Hanom_Chr02g00140421 [Helianthus anomalus]